MAASLHNCRKLSWEEKRTKGCRDILDGEISFKRHGCTLVGHLIYLVSEDNGRLQGGIFTLDINTRKWRQIVKDNGLIRCRKRLFLVRDKLYNFDSKSGSGRVKHPVWYFDLQQLTTEPCSCSNEDLVPNYGFAGEYVEALDMVVLYWGTLSAESSGQVVAFHEKAKVWERVWVKGAAPPPVRNDHCSCVHGKTHIYFFGGIYDGSLEPSNKIFRLDCSNRRFMWSEVRLQPTPAPRANSVMCCSGSRIYLFGGYSNGATDMSSHLNVYDLTNGTGVQISSRRGATPVGDLVLRLKGKMPANTLHAAVSNHDSIFILGGVSIGAEFVGILSAVR